MKKLILSSLLSVLFLSTGFAQYSSERTGYEGDYFSLEGALELFKQSYTLRDFERELNTERNYVNNLDLNYDGRIDYIRVEHRQQGNFHAVILQAVLDRRDVQDVAVIEIEILRNREAVLQIVGDEDLYGEEVYVEPREGYSDSRRGYDSDYGDFVNVYYWRPVQYILGRDYRVYASPYYWQSYPAWWSPWRPCSWSIFRPRIVIYHRHYHIVPRHRVVRVHHFYRPYRSYSYNVLQRTNQVRVKYGRSPVQRPAPDGWQDRNPGNDRDRDRDRGNVVERPRPATSSTGPRERTAVSRKEIPSSDGRDPSRNSTQRVEERSRSDADRPAVSRSTDRSGSPRQDPPASRKTIEPSSRPNPPAGRSTDRSASPRQDPPVSRKTIESSSRPEPVRRTAPQVERPSRTSTGQPRATNRPDDADRSPAARPRSSSGAPARTYEPSRSGSGSSGGASRSSTTIRSESPSRKSSTTTRSAAPAPKPKATNDTGPKRSSSRKGGGGE